MHTYGQYTAVSLRSKAKYVVETSTSTADRISLERCALSRANKLCSNEPKTAAQFKYHCENVSNSIIVYTNLQA